MEDPESTKIEDALEEDNNEPIVCGTCGATSTSSEDICNCEPNLTDVTIRRGWLS